MAGLFLLGGGAGLLGGLLPHWALHLSVDALDAGSGFLALGLGGVAGGWAARRPSWTRGRAAGVAFGFATVAAAAALAGLALLVDSQWLPALLALYGGACGIVTSLTTAVLRPALQGARATAVLNLAGVLFGAGAVASSAASWVASDWGSWRTLLWSAGAFGVAVGLLVLRSDAFRISNAPTREPDWRSALNPTTVLLGLGLLLQAAAYGVVGGWLSFYLARKLGLTIQGSLAAPAVFWAALTFGRVTATRLPRRAAVRPLLGVSALTILGCVFLLTAPQLSGAAVGAALIGVGLGALHPLTLAAVRRGAGADLGRLPSGLFGLAFLGGVLVAGLVGFASMLIGIEAVVWSVACCALAVAVVLTVIFVESRLSQTPAPAR